ncbi:MAG: response regulator [Lachnospiraceae bacterium]|jgi:Response regulator containing a CheY-like receiver domain and a GGDEF domain
MQNVLIVSEVQSYLLVSLQEKLAEVNCKVMSVQANPDLLSKIKEELDMIFIFGTEDLLNQRQGLTYLKDKALEDDVPIFVSGDPQELLEIQKDIPLHLIQKEFPRPINVGEVAESIDSYLKVFGKQNKKKILVVDDSGAMLRNVKGWLEDKYQVILANSGAMAIKYLSTNRPDLVLLDYEMPIVDGKQVLGMIRSETEFSDIPVIFLTSKGDKESVMQVMDLKPDGYLLKTMSPEQIKKSVDTFFEKKKALRH